MVFTPYATGDLAQLLFKHLGIKAPYFQDPYTSFLHPAMQLASWIYHFPIEHRKALLDATRIQAPVWLNNTLSPAFATLEPVSCLPLKEGHAIVTLYPTDLAKAIDSCLSFPVVLSLISYLIRAEGTIHLEEFQKQKQLSLDKELQAALSYETFEQKLEYTGLMGVDSSHMNPQLRGQIPHRLRTLFRLGVQRISAHFSRASTRPLLPSYDKKKNVSRDTCREYYDAIGGSISSSDIRYNVTTLDLLKLYYSTGLEVGGCLEMRQAWFFNDLKPRTYYCLGGNDFFHGMYIQQIANLFADMLPSTNPHTRFSVSRLGELDYEDLLVTYDYSSFTTSLSELRYFMFNLARVMEGVVVSILDVVRGVIEVPLSDIIDGYNDAVNFHQMFSLERFQETEEYCKVRQGRNGSLGVKGNIVFSMTLHGLSLADITGTPDKDCCVGDDALAVIRAYFLILFISCVNNLGDINPTKFTTIRRIDFEVEDDSLWYSQQFKFLKRPLNLDVSTNVPALGFLDFFPSVADVMFPSGDGIHTARPGYNRYGSARSFAMQVGRYFRLHVQRDFAPISPTEPLAEMILTMLRMVYEEIGLPLEGGVPSGFDVAVDHDGTVFRAGDFFCPPVDTIECFDTPWMDILLNRFYGSQVSLPVRVGGSIPPPLVAFTGLRFRATSDIEVLQLGEDLGFLDKQVQMRWEFFDQNISEEVWGFMNKVGHNLTEPMLCEYEFLSPPPNWWSDVVSYEYPEVIPEDPNEAYDRISTVLSGSSV